jgi:hypothetical protein
MPQAYGWANVGDEWYCQLHATSAQYQARKAARLEEIKRLRERAPEPEPDPEISDRALARRVNELVALGMYSPQEAERFIKVRSANPAQARRIIAKLAEAQKEESDEQS